MGVGPSTKAEIFPSWGSSFLFLRQPRPKPLAKSFGAGSYLCVPTFYIMGKLTGGAPALEQNETIELDPNADYATRRNMSKSEIEDAIRSGSVPHMGAHEAVDVAKAGGWEIDALIAEMEKEIGDDKKGFFDIEFKNPKHFTILLVIFASMGGLLSGLDQSLISGAQLFLPEALGLTSAQLSLVTSSMPLGAVGGAIILSPCNEHFGRRWSIIISCILYTIGAALEAGAVNFPMMIVSRLILGLGVGLEGGTVPVCLSIIQQP